VQPRRSFTPHSLDDIKEAFLAADEAPSQYQ